MEVKESRPDHGDVDRPSAPPEEVMNLKRLTRRRTFAAGVAVAVVAAGGGVVWMRHGSAAATQYRTAAATLGTVTQSLSLTGNLAPLGESDLNLGSAGRVAAVNVQPGQAVKAGQVLASLDTSSLQASVTQAQATLSSAQAKLSLDQAGATAQNLSQSEAAVRSAQTQLQSAQTALTDTQANNALTVQQAQPQGGDAVAVAQAKAQQSNDQAQAQVNSAQVQLQNAQQALAALQQGTTSQQLQMDQSQVQIAQINVDNAQKALGQGTLTAPADGVVGVVNLTVGQTISSGAGSGSSSSSSSSSSSPQISVLTPGAFQVTGTVSDTQVNQITVGQRALVTPAGATQAVKGKVTQVAAVATVTSGVATFPVVVVLDGSNPGLHAGVSASITVVVNQVVGVLTVPTAAIRGSNVQVLVNGKPQTVAVTTGASDSSRTQIVSGLNEGDNVVIATVSSTVPSGTTRTTGGGLLGGSGGRGGAGALGRTLGG
jgi:macrolide-specific efflux system membrane fusion protein